MMYAKRVIDCNGPKQTTFLGPKCNAAGPFVNENIVGALESPAETEVL